MAFGNRTAATYDVNYRVNLGEFRAENREATQVYERGIKGMSTQALKLAAAEDRLKVALARTGGASRATASAELNLRKVQAELATSAHRTSGALQAEERSLGRLARGAVAGSGVLGHLGRSVAFASTAFLGGTGLVYALRSSIKAAEEHQVVYGQLAVAVKDAGLNYATERAQIEKAVVAREKLGFTEEATVRSYITLVRATKSVTEATRLQSVAANIARARNVPLEKATDAVAKATAGQSTQLRRLIPGLDKTAKGYKLIEDAQRRTAGAAVDFGNTAAGAQAKFDVAVHRTEVTIGTALLPTVTKLLNKGADWLDQSKNQKRIQHDVNEVVKKAGTVVHDLGTAWHNADRFLGPLVRHVGGIGKVLQIAFGLAAAAKIRSFFGGMATSATVATEKVVADAVAMDRALTIATRPRNIIITTLGGGSGLGGFAGGAAAAGGKGVVGRIGQYGKPIVQKLPRGIESLGKGLAGFLGELPAAGGIGVEQGSGRVIWNQKEDQYYLLTEIAHHTYRYKISRDEARKANAGFVAKIDAFKRGGQGKGDVSGKAGINRRGATTDDTRVRPLDRRSQLDLNLSRATPGGQEELKAQQAIVAFDNKYIAEQERLLRTDTKHKQQHAKILRQLYSDRNSAQSAIDSINQGNAAQAAASASAAKQAAAERARQHRAGLTATEERLKARVKEARTPAGTKRAEDALLDFYKREMRDGQLGEKERNHYRLLLATEQRKAHDRAVRAARDAKELKVTTAEKIAEIALTKARQGTAAYAKAKTAEEKALRAEIAFYKWRANHEKAGRRQKADLDKEAAAQKKLAALMKPDGGKTGSGATTTDRGSNEAQFLAAFKDIASKFAPNYFPGPSSSGTTDSHLYDMKHESRKQTQHLDSLVKRGWFPQSHYTSASAADVFGY